MSGNVRYFAYGSNMDPTTLAERRGIAALGAAAACAHGWKLALDKPSLLGLGEGMATIVADGAACVWGVLYEIAAADMDMLDLSEGVAIGHYHRLEIDVHLRDAGGGDLPPLRAFAFASDKRDPDLAPSTRYMKLLIDGAAAHGLPDEWIAMLRAVPAREQSARARAMWPLVDAWMKNLRANHER